VAKELARVGRSAFGRSCRKMMSALPLEERASQFGLASRPSGSKLPRHKSQ